MIKIIEITQNVDEDYTNQKNVELTDTNEDNKEKIMNF